MRILLVTGSINQGGAEFQILSLANLLNKKGHNVEVLALVNYTFYLPYISENSIKYSVVDKKKWKLCHLMVAVRSIIRKRPDIVISYVRLPSLVAILSRIVGFFRFKLIISERTSLILPKYDLFYFNIALLSNRIIVNSISKYNYILNRFPLLKSRTVFIPNILNLKKLINLERIEKTSSKIRISYVGRISPEKNLLNLIIAFHLIKQKGYEVTLSLIGEANNKSYLKEIIQLIQDLSLSDSVIYNGSVTDIARVYSETDLICLVSFFEGFSNVISEALACGIPVIASNIEENRYLIENIYNGFLVDPKDPKSIAEGIESFLELTPEQIKIISENNRRKAINIFDEDSIYKKIIELF